MSNDLKVTLSLVDDFTKKLTGIESEMGSFGKQIEHINSIASKFGIGLGLGIGGSAIIEGFKELSNINKENTQVQNQLRESLGYTSIELNLQAEALGQKNLIDHKDILTVQQRLSLYTQDEEQIKKLTPAILDYAKATGKDLLTATQTVTRAIESSKGSLKGFPGHLDGAAESAERLNSVMEILNKHFHGQADAVRESKTEVDKLGFSFNELKDTLATGLFGNQAEKDLLRYKQAVKYIEEGNYLQEDSYKDALKIVEEYEKKIGDAKAKAQKEQQEQAAADALKSKFLVPGYKDEKEYKAAQKKKEDEQKEAAKEALKIQKDLDKQYQKLIKDSDDEGYKDLEAKAKKKEDLDKQYYALIKEDSDRGYADLEAKGKKKEKLEEDLREAQNFTLRNSVSNLQIMAEKWHEFGTAYKIAAETENVINTYKSATAAYSAMAGIPYVGPALGIAAAAAAIGAGLANGANIAAQQFASGGFVGGSSYTGDRVPVRVNSGEAILNTQQQKNFMAMANGNTTTNNHSNITVHLHDATGNITETITKQIRSGQATRMISTLMQKMGTR